MYKRQVYGILELVNFTHSTIYMVGAYLFYILVSIAKLPLWLGFLLSVVLTGLIGVSYEWPVSYTHLEDASK